jgi:sigma-E factor negative regulatory protein RseB
MIEPLDAYRYGRRIWLDVESKLPLQLELLDPEGRVLESFVVTELIVGDVGQQAADLESRPDGGSEPWKVLDRVEIPADGRWRLTQLPQGFTEVKRSRRKDLTDSAPVDHILVTDGLASVSVYIKQQAEDSELDLANRRLGAVNVYNRRIDGYLVTVLGDVPPETVRLIGDGVQESESTLE